MKLIDEIKAYQPCCEQEERDKAVILAFLDAYDDAFLR